MPVAFPCVAKLSAGVTNDLSDLDRRVVSETLGLDAYRTFFDGLPDAVRAAVTLAWSNGQTEGQINRLKSLKRQMYGRAGLDLLERRFLLAA